MSTQAKHMDCSPGVLHHRTHAFSTRKRPRPIRSSCCSEMVEVDGTCSHLSMISSDRNFGVYPMLMSADEMSEVTGLTYTQTYLTCQREGAQSKSARQNRNSHQSITTEFACEPRPCSHTSDSQSEGGEQTHTQSNLWSADEDDSRKLRKVCWQGSESPARLRAESPTGLSDEECHRTGLSTRLVQLEPVRHLPVEAATISEGKNPKSSQPLNLSFLPAIYITAPSETSLNLDGSVDWRDTSGGQSGGQRCDSRGKSKLSNAERLLSPLRLQSPPLTSSSNNLLQSQQDLWSSPISRSRTFRSLTSIAPRL